MINPPAPHLPSLSHLPAPSIIVGSALGAVVGYTVAGRYLTLAGLLLGGLVGVIVDKERSKRLRREQQLAMATSWP